MFHLTRLGSFGRNVPSDIDGYVPELGDDWRDMNWAFGGASDEEVDDMWEDIVSAAVAATAKADAGIREWSKGRSA